MRGGAMLPGMSVNGYYPNSLPKSSGDQSVILSALFSAVSSFLLFLSPSSSSDELLSSQEKSTGMKDVIVSIDTSKDSDAESSKPSSKATSLQNSPAIQKGGRPRLLIFF